MPVNFLPEYFSPISIPHDASMISTIYLEHTILSHRTDINRSKTTKRRFDFHPQKLVIFITFITDPIEKQSEEKGNEAMVGE